MTVVSNVALLGVGHPQALRYVGGETEGCVGTVKDLQGRSRCKYAGWDWAEMA